MLTSVHVRPRSVLPSGRLCHGKGIMLLPIVEAGGRSYSTVNFTQPGVFYVTCSKGRDCRMGLYWQFTVMPL